MDFLIKEIADKKQKKHITRQILEALPDWFGIPEARESYIAKNENQLFFAAFDANDAIGFISMEETGRSTLEIYVMGVLEEYHRKGVGRALFDNAKSRAIALGYKFIQVKTVKSGCYKIYDDTNKFYQSMGFMEFEVMETLWGENNPCQIYVMAL